MRAQAGRPPLRKPHLVAPIPISCRASCPRAPLRHEHRGGLRVLALPHVSLLDPDLTEGKFPRASILKRNEPHVGDESAVVSDGQGLQLADGELGDGKRGQFLQCQPGRNAKCRWPPPRDSLPWSGQRKRRHRLSSKPPRTDERDSAMVLVSASCVATATMSSTGFGGWFLGNKGPGQESVVKQRSAAALAITVLRGFFMGFLRNGANHTLLFG